MTLTNLETVGVLIATAFGAFPSLAYLTGSTDAKTVSIILCTFVAIAYLVVMALFVDLLKGYRVAILKTLIIVGEIMNMCVSVWGIYSVAEWSSKMGWGEIWISIVILTGIPIVSFAPVLLSIGDGTFGAYVNH